MPFSARCFHQRHPRTAAGTAATAATGRPMVAPIATVAAAAAPATNPFRRESDTTSCRDLLMPTGCALPRAFATSGDGEPARVCTRPARHDVDVRRSHVLVEARHVLLQVLAEG